MIDDLRDQIDAELPERSMLGIDVDSVVARGRRRHRNRRWLIGGGTLGVAVLAGAVLAASLAGFGSAGRPLPGPVTDGESDRPEYGADVPSLDPGIDYVWGGGEPGEPTDTSQAYTDAFLAQFEADFPEAEADLHMYLLVGHPEATDHRTAFLPTPEELFEGPDSPEPIYTRDTLSMTFQATQDDGSVYSGAPAFQFGDGMPNFIGARVLPAGTFTPDTGDDLDPAQCTPGTIDGERIECSVETVQGPSGEDIRTLDTTIYNEATGGIMYMSHCLIVYRSGGDAVIVLDEIRGPNGGAREDSDGFHDGAPQLSFEDLTGLALALPDTPIE